MQSNLKSNKHMNTEIKKNYLNNRVWFSLLSIVVNASQLPITSTSILAMALSMLANPYKQKYKHREKRKYTEITVKNLTQL